MAYRFKFERVLEVKGIRRELAQAESARRMQKVQEVETRLDHLNGTVAQTQNDLRRRLEEGELEAGRLAGYSAYLFMLERSIRMTLVELDHAKARHQEALTVVVKSRQEEEVFEKLKERDRSAYLREEERKAGAVLDEIGAQRHERLLRANGEKTW